MKARHIPVLMAVLLAFCGCERGSRPRMIGSPAPDFTIADANRTVSLHDLRGKLVVLNFWASWCPPCADEMPSLVQMQKEMGSKVTVLAVSKDTSVSAYHRFLADYQANDLLTVRDPDGTSWLLYGTTGQPETFIIDRSGIIRRKFIGPVDWTSPDIMKYLNQFSNY